MNKKKTLNDPVHGFINIPTDTIYKIVEHPWFQRLRRIKQLGVTDYVYPGALHTRFHHALGAMHLMGEAIEVLKNKGHNITDEEKEASQIAILLHDIGHGPFSHALENSILSKVSHEEISLLVFEALNKKFKNKLSLAINIFGGSYKKKYLHQLVSSQLDVDRLDYLQRDSYFTGVSEGVIGSDRILKMMQIKNNEIVFEKKGIYSIENFLNARRIMYWQVYLHKTCISAEEMLIQTFLRARYLSLKGHPVFASSELAFFLKNKVNKESFSKDSKVLDCFLQLDDFDIWASLKNWVHSDDKILRFLSTCLMERDLFKVTSSEAPFSKKEISTLQSKLGKIFDVSEKDAKFLFVNKMKTNSGYISKGSKINILNKDGKIEDVTNAVDLPNIKAISKIVKKYYLCWPKNVSL